MNAAERALGLRCGALAAASGIGLAAAPIALDDLAASLGTTPSATAAIVTAFGVGLAASSCVAGRLVDALGTRRTLDVSCALVVLATLVVVSSSTPWVLLVGRGLTGFGAGGLSVAAFVAVSAAVPGHRGAAVQGLLTATSVVVLGCGPLLGGGLVAIGGWRTALAAPLLGAVVLAAVRQRIPDADRSAASFDGTGAVLAIAGCALATVALQAPGLDLGTAVAIVLGVAAVIAVGLLVRRARRRPGSFLPVVVLDDPRVRALAGLSASCFGSYVVLGTVIPGQIGDATGWTALAVGALLVPSAVAGAVSAVVSGRAATGTGDAPRLLVRLALTGAAGMLVAAVVPGTAGPLIGACLGMAAFAGAQVVLIAATSALVPATELGGALGAMNFALLAGGSLGSGLLATLLGSVSPEAALALLAAAPLLAAALGASTARPRREPPTRKKAVA